MTVEIIKHGNACNQQHPDSYVCPECGSSLHDTKCWEPAKDTYRIKCMSCGCIWRTDER